MIVRLHVPGDLEISSGSKIDVEIDDDFSLRSCILRYGIGGGWADFDLTENVEIIPPQEWLDSEQTELNIGED